MKRILITGGLGFIGSHTTIRLLEEGYECLILDSLVNSSLKSLERLNVLINKINPKYLKNLSFKKGDIRDINLLRKIFSESLKSDKFFDGVIHFAGLKSIKESNIKPLDYWDVNVLGSINLIKVMEEFNCRNLIFSSSATIYGSSEKLPFSEKAIVRPINPYGNTKAIVEKILEDITKTNKKEWRIASLRYFNPIGAHESGLIGEDPLNIPNNIFPLILEVAKKNIKSFEVFGNDWETKDGTGVRDYVHIMDLSEAHLKALEFLSNSSPQYLVLNIGTGEGTSVLELINAFKNETGIEIPYIFKNKREGDIAAAVADNSLSKKILNWIPQRNIRNMCEDGWNWYSKK